MAQLLKIPVAKLGSWFHEVHGTVSFTGDDLRSMEANFRGNVRGYEPYLKAGHNEKGPDIYDDEKAEAHMVDMVREGDVLFGLFDPHSEEVVSDVVNQKYRYASANLIRSAKDRQTGKSISGPILRGVSLTNTPSIPNMPRNSMVHSDSLAEMLSDDFVYETTTIRMSPSNGATMSATTPVTPPAPEAPAVAAEAAAPAEVVTPPTTEEKTMGFMATIAKGFETLLEKLTPAIETAKTEVATEVAATEKTAEELAAEVEAEAVALAAAAQKAIDDAAAAAEAATLEAKTIALQAEVDALRAAAAITETARLAAEAQAAVAETERLAAEAASQLAAEVAAAEEAARKEATYVQMLSDRVTTLVAAGVPPLEAEKAKNLVLALKGSINTVMLSDKDEPQALEDVVFELLSDRVGTIDFGQVGAVDSQAVNAGSAPVALASQGMSPANPWKGRAGKFSK